MRRIKSFLAGGVAVSFLCCAIAIGALSAEASNATIWSLLAISAATTAVLFVALMVVS